MNAVWNSYGQLCGCPEIFKKSCKFFCRELDIRVPDIVTSAYWKTQETMISLLRFRVSHGSASAHSNKEAPCPS